MNPNTFLCPKCSHPLFSSETTLTSSNSILRERHCKHCAFSMLTEEKEVPRPPTAPRKKHLHDAAIIQRYRSGFSLRQISELDGRSYWTIRNHLRRNNIVLRSRGGANNPTGRKGKDT